MDPLFISEITQFNDRSCDMQTLVKSFEMCEVPVRCAKFIVRKQWIVAGTDDMHLRVYNYNTMEKVKAWEAHTDYIRYVEIHPNRPFIIR
jgi:coatomer subunit beta'